MAYASTSEIKRYLGITSADDDALLAMLAESATGIIDNLTGRTFAASADATKYHTVDNVDGDTLWMNADIASITSITNGDGVAVASTNWRTLPRNDTPYYAVELKDDSAVTWDTDSGDIAVVGRWAYSTTPPPVISQVCTRITAYLYRQKDNMGELDRALIAGNTTLLPAELPKDIILLLATYKRTGGG